MWDMWGKLRWQDFCIGLLILLKISLFYYVTETKINYIFAVFITLIVIVLIIGSFSTVKHKGTIIAFSLAFFLLSLLMFADSMYYVYFNQLPSVKQLAQVNSMAALDFETFIVTLPTINLLLFGDIPFVISYFVFLNRRICPRRHKHFHGQIKLAFGIVIGILIIGVINPLQMNAIKIMNKTEIVTYHLRDLYEQVIDGDISEQEVSKVLEELAFDENTVNEAYESLGGIGADMNLIVIQVESLNNFVLQRVYEGIELTPNLNTWLENNTLYFNHYYQTIGRGNTSDAEFATNNSLYPVIEGESYRLYETNDYYGLPKLLLDAGYSTKAYHGYEGDFWNRENAYKGQGFQDFMSLEDMVYDEKMAFGLSDESFYRQALEDILMREKEEEYDKTYSFLISLSCHYPYILPESYHIKFDQGDSRSDSLFADYLAGVRYSDYALGQFFEAFQASELADHTIVAIYGDHHGLNWKQQDNSLYISEMIGKVYDYDSMLNIPLIIYIPGLDDMEIGSRLIEKAGGQVDFLPTISYLMDLEEKSIQFGSNLFEEEEGFIASLTYMTHGSFILDKVFYEASASEVFEEGRLMSIESGRRISDMEAYRKYFEKSLKWTRVSKYLLDENQLLYE